MKAFKPFLAIMILIALSCLSSVQGQYGTANTYSSSTSTSSSTSSAISPYAQYYTMPSGQTPSTHIGAPVQVDIIGKTPANLYFSTQNQIVPYSQYASNPATTGAISMWIQGATDWAQYAVIPQGATASLLTVSPTGGSGYINEIRPDGTMYRSNFYFYPYSTLSFYADTIGRHVLSFGLNGQVSNTVIIDVTGTYVPPAIDYLSSAYPGYYNGYYPGIYGDLGYARPGVSVASNGATTSVTSNGETTTVSPSGETTVTPSGGTATVTPITDDGTGSTITITK